MKEVGGGSPQSGLLGDHRQEVRARTQAARAGVILPGWRCPRLLEGPAGSSRSPGLMVGKREKVVG